MGNGNNIVNFDKKGVASYGLTEMDINSANSATQGAAEAAAPAGEVAGTPKGKTPPPMGSFDFKQFMAPKAPVTTPVEEEAKPTVLPKPGDTTIPVAGEEPVVEKPAPAVEPVAVPAEETAVVA